MARKMRRMMAFAGAALVIYSATLLYGGTHKGRAVFLAVIAAALVIMSFI